jgi:hypothetical protein
MGKRYIIACACCGKRHEVNRSDAVACSTRCRVWLHRHPERLRRLRAFAAFTGNSSLFGLLCDYGNEAVVPGFERNWGKELDDTLAKFLEEAT